MTGKELISTVAINGFDELTLTRKKDATIITLKKGNMEKKGMVYDDYVYSLSLDVLGEKLREMVRGFEDDL